MSRKLAKLYKPCDKLDKYDNEPYMKNPLLKIHLSQIRERRHCEVLQRRAALVRLFLALSCRFLENFFDLQEKIKVCRRPAVDLGDAIPIHESFYVEQLRQYVSKAPVPKMLKRMENKILTSVPKRLGEKYPKIVDNYMGEVQEHFDLIMKTFSTQRILKPKPGDFIPPRCDFRFKYLGKTENYDQFVQNREKLRKCLMIPQPFIRCIVHYSYTDFPLILNDFSKYRQRGEMTLHDLRDRGKEDMLTNAAFITKIWYPKIVKIFTKHYKKRTLQYPLLWKRAFNCASGLIKRQLTDLKIRSLQHLNEVILDREQIPFIKLMTICEDNRLDLFPALQEIYNVYLDFQNTIMRIGDQLESLEIMIDHLKFKRASPLLNVDLGDVLTLEATNKLQNSLIIAYSPIAEYLQNFQSEFEGLYESKVAEEMESFLAEPKTYQEYLGRIEDVKVFDEKLKRLVQKEYFDMGIVIQMDAIASLRQISAQVIQKVAVEISEIHRTESEQICQEFVQMKRKALTIPRSTEQLIQNGEYMLRVKQVIMDELRERIEETLKVKGVNLFSDFSSKIVQKITSNG
jgi:dynein heavy chain, axonemal